MSKTDIVFIFIGVVIVGVIGSFVPVPDWQLRQSVTPVIKVIAPDEAPLGAEVSLIGSGFTPEHNSLHFGEGLAYINDLASLDGKVITFILPESFDGCTPDGTECVGALLGPIPGETYEVRVINAQGTSNAVSFTVASHEVSPAPRPVPWPVPEPEQKEEITTMREGQREGPFLLEKIYPDRVAGLNFLEYPIPRDIGLPLTLRIGETASNGCTIQLTLIRITGNTATFRKNTDFNRPCPICLSGATQIDTPLGLKPVRDLRTGMSVWTVNGSGLRVPEVIIKISKVPVPKSHRMVHVVLEDKRATESEPRLRREVFASPRHPTIDGRTVGDLVAGSLYKGSRVVSVDLVPYTEGATYDILPSGETGFYWANGILLDSTLH